MIQFIAKREWLLALATIKRWPFHLVYANSMLAVCVRKFICYAMLSALLLNSRYYRQVECSAKRRSGRGRRYQIWCRIVESRDVSSIYAHQSRFRKYNYVQYSMWSRLIAAMRTNKGAGAFSHANDKSTERIRRNLGASKNIVWFSHHLMHTLLVAQRSISKTRSSTAKAQIPKTNLNSKCSRQPQKMCDCLLWATSRNPMFFR